MYTKDTLEKLLDLIPEYIFFRDQDGKNIYCNKSYSKEFIGLPKEEIYGKKYDEIPVLKKFHKIGILKDIELLETNSPVFYEQVITKSDGSTQDIKISKYPSFDEYGNINGILGIIEDISYEKELDKLREGFFSNVRHEFRTPLNMIFSNIQLLEYKCSKCPKNSHDNCKDCFIQNIRQIYTNSLRLLKLSNNFIDLTNIQNGTYTFSPRNYELITFVENICENINGYKQFNGINIIFDTDIEELIVSFDYLHLERILLNLISNAIKFNNIDGSVFVSISHNSNVIKISIRDTGVGIPKDSINKIFTTFYNVEDRLTKISEGSGVGLALCKSLVEMHRGNIKVYSDVGVGSEFIVSIPNIYNEEEDVDLSCLNIDENTLSRIQMELSDIYDYYEN